LHVPGGTPVQADQLGSGSIDQQIEGNGQKNGQSQPFFPKQGERDGEAHESVVAESTAEDPGASAPLRDTKETQGGDTEQAVAQDQDRAQHGGEDAVPNEGGVVGPDQGGENGCREGDIHQQPAECAGSGGGQCAPADNAIARPNEEEQLQQIKKNRLQIERQKINSPSCPGLQFCPKAKPNRKDGQALEMGR
jgi:hypothetical protein